MTKICQLSSKRPGTGNNVSHSERKTRRRFLPNLTKRKIVDPVTGKIIKVKISTSAQKTLLKNPKKFAQEIKKIMARKAKMTHKAKTTKG